MCVCPEGERRPGEVAGLGFVQYVQRQPLGSLDLGDGHWHLAILHCGICGKDHF